MVEPLSPRIMTDRYIMKFVSDTGIGPNGMEMGPSKQIRAVIIEVLVMK